MKPTFTPIGAASHRYLRGAQSMFDPYPDVLSKFIFLKWNGKNLGLVPKGFRVILY